MFKIEVTAKTANEAIAEILRGKEWKRTVINHLTFAAATLITEDVNGTGCYKSQSKNTPVR